MLLLLLVLLLIVLLLLALPLVFFMACVFWGDKTKKKVVHF